MKNLPLLFLCGFFTLTIFSCRSVDRAKIYPRMVADQDPISAGVIDVEFDKPFSPDAERKEVDVFFYPRYNAVVLEFRYEFVRYRQFWDPEARRRFAEALDRYKADYTDKKLTNKFSRSRTAYGKFTGWTEWGFFTYTTPGLAYPTIELGYRFKGKSPYFMVLQRSAPEEYSAGEDNPYPDSLQIAMYYTRAQADELVKKFDQDYLMSLLNPVRDPASILPPEEEYQEFGNQ